MQIARAAIFDRSQQRELSQMERLCSEVFWAQLTRAQQRPAEQVLTEPQQAMQLVSEVPCESEAGSAKSPASCSASPEWGSSCPCAPDPAWS